jgi:hypothetical protein
MNYQKIYDSIISKAKSENRTKNKITYYEAHHIIPECIGGEGKEFQWKTHPNIVLLTAREHFLCHLLLCEIYPKNTKIHYASWLMCIKRNDKAKIEYKISNRTYERLRIEHSKRVSKSQKGKHHTEESRLKMSNFQKGKPGLLAERNGMYGKHHTEEHKKKLSKLMKGKKMPDSQKLSTSMRFKGIPLTEEHRKKVSENHADVSGYKNPMYGKPSPRRIPYINTKTGVIHAHRKEAAKYYGISMRQVDNMIKKGILLKN